MPPRPSRRILLPPTAALALAAMAACADSTTAPTVADRATVAPRGPLFAVVSNFAYGEIFDFDGAKVFFGAASGIPNCGPGTAGDWACLPPKPWKPTDFDVAMHLRDRSAWDTPESFRAMHGDYCQPYDNGADVSRVIDTISHHAAKYDDMNYRCRNHMMTAIRSSGYGVIYVTPNATISVPSSGSATIRWALSTFRTSANDWIDVWVTPWADNLKLPLDAALNGVDLQGPPSRAIHVRMTSASQTQTRFEAFQVDNFGETPLVSTTSSVTNFYESATAQSATRRDTFELTISGDRVKLRFWKGDVRAGNPAFPNITVAYASRDLIDAPLVSSPVAWGSSVVQFGHHSMTQTAPGVGGTWHWDDFQMSPAVGFTTIRANNVEGASLPNDRYADSKHPDMVLASAMPATGDRYLRFAAYGDKVRVSFGNGKWIDAVRQPAAQNVDGRFQSYFVPIPADVGSSTTVSFKAKKDKLAAEPTNEDDGAWRVRDVSVWVR